jgi:hypothetical protein
MKKNNILMVAVGLVVLYVLYKKFYKNGGLQTTTQPEEKSGARGRVKKDPTPQGMIGTRNGDGTCACTHDYQSITIGCPNAFSCQKCCEDYLNQRQRRW